MKQRLSKVLCAIALVLSSCYVIQTTEHVKAQILDIDYYPMACPAFEVTHIKSDGSMDKLNCYDNFDDAKREMQLYGKGTVVRHVNSKSPTKIIAANSGTVFSYPQRSGRNTAYLQQYYEIVKPTFNKETYVTVHRPMGYYGTTSYNAYDGSGLVHIVMNGFDGYINLSECDIVPTVAIENGIALYLGGTDDLRYMEAPFKVKAHQPYYAVEQNGNYTDLVYHWFSGWANPSDASYEPKEFTHAIGPAASWMNLYSRYYSDDGYTFYIDPEHTVQAGIYYNYYQFLPMRTKSEIPSSVYDSYLIRKGIDSDSKMWNTSELFIKGQEEYGVNALLTFAMGCLESAFGTSYYATQRNNLFGVAAYDNNPDYATYFPSVKDCVENQMGILLRTYLNTGHHYFFGQHLGNKGSGFNVKYAGEPFWGMKIAAIAYDIDKCSKNYDGTLTDYNRVALGVIPDDVRTNISKTPGGSTLYETAYGATYQKNHIVPIIGESGNYYEIQSADYVDIFGNAVTSLKGVGLMDYDWSRSVGWIGKNNVTRINDAPIVSVPVISTVTNPNSGLFDGFYTYGDFKSKVSDAYFNKDGSLHIAGYVYRDQLKLKPTDSVTVTLNLVDMEFLNQVSVEVTPKVVDDMILTFDADIGGIQWLSKGSYLVMAKANYGSLGCPDDYDYLAIGDAKDSSVTFGGIPYNVCASKGVGTPMLMVQKTK